MVLEVQYTGHMLDHTATAMLHIFASNPDMYSQVRDKDRVRIATPQYGFFC